MLHRKAARGYLLLFLLFFAAPGLQAQALPAGLEELDAYIRQAMREWEVPGLAIAIVKDDSVVFARGYGVRELGRAEPVDEHTLFAIASTSKAFTAAALGMLVDEGRLRWDDPVTQHLPTFQLRDPYVTRELTVRDLLTHRVGVARSDLLWIASPFDRAEILRRARHLPTTASFRAQYGYHNLMYIAAGEVIEAVTGTSWDDFLEGRFFRPLGMARSTTRAAVVEARENVSGSHTRVDGRVQQIARRNYDAIGGAGAVFSSAREMTRWIRLHLGRGSFEGERLLREGTVREMQTPQTVMRADTATERLFPGTHLRAYGLGWYLQDYHGHKLVHHSGSINFTRTHVGMIPELNLGVVAIANLSTSDLQRALMFRVLDAYLGLPPRDWSAELLEHWRRGQERAAQQAREVEAARVRGTRPSLPLERYAGTYSSEVFGEMHLRREGSRLVLEYTPEYTADLEHWHHDTFRATWRSPGFGRVFVTFTLNRAGDVGAMQVEDFGEFRRARQATGAAARQ